MSEILIIVPSEWTHINYDEIISITNYTLYAFQELQGRSMNDLNELLHNNGWLPAERTVIDVLVLNEQIYFKME